MSHKSRRHSVAAGLGLAAGSALTAGFIAEAARPSFWPTAPPWPTLGAGGSRPAPYSRSAAPTF